MNINLITEEQYRARNGEHGIAYVVLLIYLTIMTCLGLSFIHRVGIEAKIVMNKTIASQAQCLARSAASHAMWGMLNVPGFAPDGNMYYLHSLGSGRYGYKVRKPTETTFATIAAIGVMGENVVEQGYVPYIIPSNVYTAYGNSTSGMPFYRRLIGADWNAPSDVLLGGGNGPRWVELEGCPIRKELLCGSIDAIGEIKVAVYDGTTWGNAEPFGHGDQNFKCFDIAYESQSGDALVVGRVDATTSVGYNSWDGSGWLHANPQSAFALDAGVVSLVTMASCPGNDDILISTVDTNHDLRIVHWDGSFNDLGEIEGSMPVDDYGVAQNVYETQSGDALVLWTARGTIRYRVWNGVALGPEATVPGFPDDVYVLRAAADPASDYIIVAGIDDRYDINVAVWDGDNWIDSREIEASAPNYNIQCFDVAWEASGDDAVIVYNRYGSNNLKVLPWKKGALLADSTEQIGPDLQAKPSNVRLLPIAGTEKIVCLATNDVNELRYSLWTGNNLRGDPGILLESSMFSAWTRAVYDLAEANVPRTGGTGTGSAGGNLPPTVEAGPEQTIYLPSDAILDGTVTDDGQPDPPATVTTTWTQESGPGTVTFGDPSQVDTTATFSETGTYVLRLTADDSDLNTFDEVTIIVKSCPLLYVVKDPITLQDQESQRKALMESWGFSVTLIDDDDTQANFDQAVLENDVVYLSYSMQPSALGTKLDNPSIGVVDENMDSYDEFGFSERSGTKISQTAITINDNTHYITSGLPMGDLTIVSSNGTFTVVDVSFAIAPDLGLLAEVPGVSTDITLSVLETGAQCWDGATAQGRRVQLPWDAGAFDIALLNTDGRTIMKRAIEWAGNWEGGCSGGDICNGLVGYWELDETSGSTVASDSSSNGNNGTLTSMDPSTDWVPGHIEGGLDFDGSNDRITVPHDANLALTGGMTFAAWGNTRVTSGGYKAILAKDFPGNGLSNYWFGISNDELMFGLFAAGGFQVVTTPSSNLQPGTWYHLAATFDPDNDIVRLYVNGTEVHSGPFTYEPTTETVDLWIGHSVDGEYWDGQLDEVRIYSRVLGPGEITQLHALTEGGGCGSGGGGPLLFVVPDASLPSTQDNDRKTLMEGWGWTVTFISASATQSEFDDEVAINKVAYVTEQITPDDLNTKLRETTIGVVNEEGQLIDDFGMASGSPTAITITNGSITDNTHYITSPFALGDLVLSDPWQPFTYVNTGVAAGVQVIATVWNKPSLMVADTGAELLGATPAAGRRVQLPWGSSGFDFNAINVDGQTIMKRAIDWAASGSGGGGGGDTDPPTPDPMTWATPPAAIGAISITMTATTATDLNGVEYYFECTAGGGNDSGWQDSPIYVDTGLSPNTSYTYRVKATDKAVPPNETGWSTEESATTPTAPEMFVTDIAMGFRKQGTNYFGQATVWIKDDGGMDVSGALVVGDWSGAVSGGEMGTTGGDGKIFFESAAKKNGGTFTFTVTDVTKSGYVYNPALNVMTSNSITVP